MLCKIKYFKRVPRIQLKMALGKKPVATPAEDLLISSAAEITQRSVNSVTKEGNDTIGREGSAGNENLGNPAPNELSKSRKLMIPSHENSEFYLTKEVTKIGTTKTDEKTDQNVRSGSGQLIAFTRRKRKAFMQSSP
jgi:hypothetical protein